MLILAGCRDLYYLLNEGSQTYKKTSWVGSLHADSGGVPRFELGTSRTRTTFKKNCTVTIFRHLLFCQGIEAASQYLLGRRNDYKRLRILPGYGIL